MKRIFSILFALVLVVSLMLVPAASVGASPGPGLVGQWHLDEGSGATTVSDSSGTTPPNDGTIYGATPGVAGKFGNALSFDGTDDYVSVPDSSSLNFGTGDFTIEAWVKLSTTSHPGIYYGVFDKGQVTPASEGRYSLFITPANRLRLHIGDPSYGLFWRDSTLAIGDTQWHYVAVSVDRDGNAIFALDGAQESVDVSASSSYDTSSTTSATIGVRVDSAKWYFDGLIDEVRIWDTAHPPLHVDDDGAQYATPYTTIQAAVDAAAPGDTIIVHEGTYVENVEVSVSVTIQAAAGEAMPVIDGSANAASGWAGSIIRIAANNVTIDGFELKDGANGIAGVTSNSVFKNNIIHDNLNYVGSNGIGILLWGENDNNVIENNTIYNNDRQGIFIGYSDATKISTGNTISGNKIHHNGLYTLPNGPDASAYGIQLWNADENTISGNKIHHHDDWFPYGGTTFDFAQGIYLHNSVANTVTNNDLHHNNYGVGIWSPARGAGTNSINYNNIFQNTGFGVRSFDTSAVDATNNWWGHRSGPTHSGNPGGRGDAVSNNVNYNPCERKPVTPRR